MVGAIGNGDLELARLPPQTPLWRRGRCWRSLLATEIGLAELACGECPYLPVLRVQGATPALRLRMCAGHRTCRVEQQKRGSVEEADGGEV